VITGGNIYSLRKPSVEEREIQINEFLIKIALVKKMEVNKNPKTLLMFLNNGLRNIFRKIGYSEIAKSGKFYRISNPEKIDNELKLFSGYKANFMLLENGFYLRVDTSKKIVRNETVLDFINAFYIKNANKEKDEKRMILKSILLGQIVMTNYGKARYAKIIDILFDTVDGYKLIGTDTTLRSYFETKYSLKIGNAKQPLIEAESRSKK
jgi:hypothetical protein